MNYPDDTIKEWSKISTLNLTPEDYGYLALFLSIVKKMSCDKSLIAIKGQREFSRTKGNYE
jgi:hypothetical protein